MAVEEAKEEEEDFYEEEEGGLERDRRRTFLGGTARVQVVGFLFVPGVGASPVHMLLAVSCCCASGPLHSNLQLEHGSGLTKLEESKAGGQGLKVHNRLQADAVDGTWGFDRETAIFNGGGARPHGSTRGTGACVPGNLDLPEGWRGCGAFP